MMTEPPFAVIVLSFVSAEPSKLIVLSDVVVMMPVDWFKTEVRTKSTVPCGSAMVEPESTTVPPKKMRDDPLPLAAMSPALPVASPSKVNVPPLISSIVPPP